jgi:hypothetical protein
MENRRYSSETLYPFVPAAITYRNQIKGILDCLISVNGPAASAAPSSSNPYFRLTLVTVTALVNTYSFQAVSADGTRYISFSVPRGSGIVRITSGTSVLVVNSSAMFDTVGSYVTAANIEPGRVCWQTDEVESVGLANELRKHDPAQRNNLPCTTLVSYSYDGATIKLVDGYNCELSYDEASETLFINASAGLGKGLPETTPWDSSPPDVENGVKTINGINNNGNVDIKPGASLTLSISANTVILTVIKDIEK